MSAAPKEEATHDQKREAQWASKALLLSKKANPVSSCAACEAVRCLCESSQIGKAGKPGGAPAAAWKPAGRPGGACKPPGCWASVSAPDQDTGPGGL